ncbi:hypothetical protein E2C01_051772 [Portunus trituberculatus]|uniref:Uncharacterized protein n=1 Tax=Portunus trituberculatus TaxID=210409 RepID=A0A5B7GMM7_PORTR|nr:hypothetical protein [Portunus trituberculatus]
MSLYQKGIIVCTSRGCVGKGTVALIGLNVLGRQVSCAPHDAALAWPWLDLAAWFGVPGERVRPGCHQDGERGARGLLRGDVGVHGHRGVARGAWVQGGVFREAECRLCQRLAEPTAIEGRAALTWVSVAVTCLGGVSATLDLLVSQLNAVSLMKLTVPRICFLVAAGVLVVLLTSVALILAVLVIHDFRLLVPCLCGKLSLAVGGRAGVLGREEHGRRMAGRRRGRRGRPCWLRSGGHVCLGGAVYPRWWGGVHGTGRWGPHSTVRVLRRFGLSGPQTCTLPWACGSLSAGLAGLDKGAVPEGGTGLTGIPTGVEVRPALLHRHCSAEAPRGAVCCVCGLLTVGCPALLAGRQGVPGAHPAHRTAPRHGTHGSAVRPLETLRGPLWRSRPLVGRAGHQVRVAALSVSTGVRDWTPPSPLLQLCE